MKRSANLRDNGRGTREMRDHSEVLVTPAGRNNRFSNERTLMTSSVLLPKQVIGQDRQLAPRALNSGDRPSCSTPANDSKPIEDPGNTKSDMAVLVPVIGMILLSLAAYYLFWAKVTSNWPFAL